MQKPQRQELVCSKNSMEAIVAGEELLKGRIIGSDVRETVREAGRLHGVLKVLSRLLFY